MSTTTPKARRISSCIDRYVETCRWSRMEKTLDIKSTFIIEKQNVTWSIHFVISPTESIITFSTNPANALRETHQIICCLFYDLHSDSVLTYDGHQLANGEKFEFFTYQDIEYFIDPGDGVSDRVNIYFDVITFDKSSLTRFRPENDLLASSFFDSGEYSDMTITTAQKEFKVHKLVLASRSPVFAAMFRNDMKEMVTGGVKIENVSTEVFEEMLRYMYSNACPKLSEMTCELYAAAHLYDVQDLQDVCVDYLLKNMRLDIVTPTLKLCDIYGLEIIRERAMKLVDDNEALLVEQQDYLIYLQESLKIDNVAKNLLLAKKYELFEFQRFLMDFIAKNYAKVMKNDDYRKMYYDGESIKLILEIDEYISNNIVKPQL